MRVFGYILFPSATPQSSVAATEAEAAAKWEAMLAPHMKDWYDRDQKYLSDSGEKIATAEKIVEDAQNHSLHDVYGYYHVQGPYIADQLQYVMNSLHSQAHAVLAGVSTTRCENPSAMTEANENSQSAMGNNASNETTEANRPVTADDTATAATLQGQSTAIAQSVDEPLPKGIVQNYLKQSLDQHPLLGGVIPPKTAAELKVLS